jgi:hypothetical protein
LQLPWIGSQRLENNVRHPLSSVEGARYQTEENKMANHSQTVERIPLQGPIVSEDLQPKVPDWVEKLAWLMDRSIPIGKRWSIGLDGIVGLFPGVGDLAGSFVSALIVASATQAGLPRAAIARMVANVAVDTALGGIPFIGDLFDFAYKANTKNIKIYQEHVQGRTQKVRNWMFTLGVSLCLLALMAVPVAAIIYVFRLLQR